MAAWWEHSAESADVVNDDGGDDEDDDDDDVDDLLLSDSAKSLYSESATAGLGQIVKAKTLVKKQRTFLQLLLCLFDASSGVDGGQLVAAVNFVRAELLRCTRTAATYGKQENALSNLQQRLYLPYCRLLLMQMTDYVNHMGQWALCTLRALERAKRELVGNPLGYNKLLSTLALSDRFHLVLKSAVMTASFLCFGVSRSQVLTGAVWVGFESNRFHLQQCYGRFVSGWAIHQTTGQVIVFIVQDKVAFKGEPTPHEPDTFCNFIFGLALLIHQQQLAILKEAKVNFPVVTNKTVQGMKSMAFPQLHMHPTKGEEGGQLVLKGLGGAKSKIFVGASKANWWYRVLVYGFMNPNPDLAPCLLPYSDIGQIEYFGGKMTAFQIKDCIKGLRDYRKLISIALGSAAGGDGSIVAALALTMRHSEEMHEDTYDKLTVARECVVASRNVAMAIFGRSPKHFAVSREADEDKKFGDALKEVSKCVLDIVTPADLSLLPILLALPGATEVHNYMHASWESTHAQLMSCCSEPTDDVPALLVYIPQYIKVFNVPCLPLGTATQLTCDGCNENLVVEKFSCQEPPFGCMAEGNYVLRYNNNSTHYKSLSSSVAEDYVDFMRKYPTFHIAHCPRDPPSDDSSSHSFAFALAVSNVVSNAPGHRRWTQEAIGAELLFPKEKQ
jgi:hypothetical protein